MVHRLDSTITSKDALLDCWRYHLLHKDDTKVKTNIGDAMVSGDQQKGKIPAQKAKQDLADRLSKALRDNLRRRKVQKRSRKSIGVDVALVKQPEEGV